METRGHSVPWGISRMAPYAETAPVLLLIPEIDPESQMAVAIDEHGCRVELVNHPTSNHTSTNSSTNTSNYTSTGLPNSSDSDNNYDYDTNTDSDHHHHW